MKIFLKFLSLSLLITASIHCMDHKHRQTQAELDARQFEHEKESKRKSAAEKSDDYESRLYRENILVQAFNKLPHRGNPITQETLHQKLHIRLQNYIGQFIRCSNKHPHYYPKEVMPAIIKFSDTAIYETSYGAFVPTINEKEPKYATAFEMLEDNEKQLREFLFKNRPSTKSQKPWIIGQTRFFMIQESFRKFWGSHIQHFGQVAVPKEKSRICKTIDHERLRDEPNYRDEGVTSHIYSDGEILFMLHYHEHEKLLQSLSNEQLDYIISLYESHRQALKKNAGIIHINSEQQDIHYSLPQFIQDMLENNYTIDKIARVRKNWSNLGLAALVVAVGKFAIEYLWT